MVKIITIKGMSCGHCKAAVEKALNALDGVKAEVDLERNNAKVILTAEVADYTLKNAITDAGYEVVSIEKSIEY